MPVPEPTVKIEKLLSLCTAERPACAEAAREAHQGLREAGFTVLEGSGKLEDDFDAILLFGGDGFLMETLHRLEFPSVPIFGVNFGTVGFLMNPTATLARLPDILREERFVTVTYPILAGQATLEDGGERTCHAFNEFVLERQTGQSVRLKVSIDGVPFNRFAGDGFVVSTPAGSTAYNLAAGGPAIHPRVSGLVLTPLYPHRAEPFHSMQFSLLLPPECRITVLSEDLPKRHMRLVADGHAVEEVSRVEIRDSGRRVTLLRTLERDFIRTLSQKFIGSEFGGDIIA